MPLFPLYEYHVKINTTPGRTARIPLASFAMKEVCARQLSCAWRCEEFLRDQDGINLTGEDSSVDYEMHRNMFAVRSEHENELLAGALTGQFVRRSPVLGVEAVPVEVA